ncbi:MAG: hypothetical protein IKT14_08115, partial [Clostridiales bacterium]|nr:hypothetical protein [Clostridiales bacterium]
MKVINDTVYSDNGNTEEQVNLDILSVFSRDYMFLYYHNVKSDKRALRLMDYDAADITNDELGSAGDPYSEMIRLIKEHIHPDDLEDVLSAVNVDSYLEALKNTNREIINARWKYREFGYLYNQLIISKTGEPESEPEAVVIGLKEVGREARERIIRESINRKYASTVFALSQEYPEVFIVDLDKNEMTPCYLSPTTAGAFEESGGTLDYDNAISAYIMDTVIQDQKEHLLLVLSREYVKWSLRKSDTYLREYLNSDNKYCEIKYVQPEQGDDISTVIMGYGVKDDEIRSKMEDARERDFQQSLMDG